MNSRFRDGFKTGLKNIASSLSKKGGIKQEDRVYERPGRLKQKYPSIQRHFDVRCEVETVTKKQNPENRRKLKTGIVTSMC
jgi:hypothetical protein